MPRFIVSLMLLLPFSGGLVAQQRYDNAQVPRYEIGAQFDVNRLSGVEEWGGGVGGRFDVNLDEHFAFDAYLTYRKHILFPPNGLPPNPEISQANGLLGLRIGRRRCKGGFFAHARGGFQHFGTWDGLSLFSRRSFPVAEVGGTFERYRGPVILRLDAGEMIIPYGDATVSPVFRGPASSSPTGPLGTRASLLVGLGFAIRF